jgi:peptidoglycan hydrolase-like protein with peptidoglycan-binding domain
MKRLFILVFVFSAFIFNFNVVSAGLTTEQVNQVINLLNSFGAEPTVVSNVKIALTETATTPILALNKEVKIGSRGKDVVNIQKFLKEKGYYSGKLDGSYGPITKRSVEVFQVERGIPATGVVDVETKKVVNELIRVMPISGPTPAIPKDKSVVTPTPCPLVDVNGVATHVCPPKEAIPVNNAIKVISPNGGETLFKGSKNTIKWNAPANISNVTIALDKMYECNASAGSVCAALVSSRVLTITEKYSNTGSFEWDIPTTLDLGRYKITIDSYDKTAISSDDSDASFTISSPITTY